MVFAEFVSKPLQDPNQAARAPESRRLTGALYHRNAKRKRRREPDVAGIQRVMVIAGSRG